MNDRIEASFSSQFPELDGLLKDLARAKVPSFPAGISAPNDPASSATVAPTVPTAGFLALNHPRSIIARCRIGVGQTEALRERLRGPVFEVHSPGVHNARFVILDDDHLMFTAIYDVTETNVLRFLQVNAATIDQVFGFCSGYPEQGAGDMAALDNYLTSQNVKVELQFNAYIDPGESQVREAVASRESFLGFVKAVQHDPGGILVHYGSFLDDSKRQIDAAAERHLADLQREYQVVPGNKTTAFTMVTTIKPEVRAQVALRAVLAFGNWTVNNLRINPISEMVTVHYARFGIWNLDKLMFASIYDGDWVQYVEDFSTRIPFQMDKVWGNCVGWPEDGAKDTDALRAFLEEHTVPTDVFYSAYMDVTSKDILASYGLAKELWNFTRIPPTDAQSFRSRYLDFLSANQGLLP